MVPILFGITLVVFALSAHLAVSVAAVAVLGFCSTFGSVGANTLLQTASFPRMRGRVMGLHGLTMMGIMPLGVMLEGALGSALGVPTILVAGGGLTALAALAIALRAERLRHLE